MFNTIIMLLIAFAFLLFMAYLTWDVYKEHKNHFDKQV